MILAVEALRTTWLGLQGQTGAESSPPIRKKTGTPTDCIRIGMDEDGIASASERYQGQGLVNDTPKERSDVLLQAAR